MLSRSSSLLRRRLTCRLSSWSPGRVGGSLQEELSHHGEEHCAARAQPERFQAASYCCISFFSQGGTSPTSHASHSPHLRFTSFADSFSGRTVLDYQRYSSTSSAGADTAEDDGTSIQKQQVELSEGLEVSGIHGAGVEKGRADVEGDGEGDVHHDVVDARESVQVEEQQQVGGEGGWVAPEGFVELCSQSIDIEGKRFFFDLSSSTEGKNLKITERSKGGRRKSNVFIPYQALPYVIDTWAYYLQEGSKETDEIVNKEIEIGKRVISFELRKNKDGRFIKMMEETPGRRPSSVYVPSGYDLEGWSDFRHALIDVAEEAKEFEEKDSAPEGGSEGGGEGETLLAKSMAADRFRRNVRTFHDESRGRKFFFEIIGKEKEQRLRISQVTVRGGTKTSIPVPFSALKEFQAALADKIQEMTADNETDKAADVSQDSVGQ
eukprot:TRINITY_DN2968_c0_g1_i2.p1 TRINITY_DN2968_c0_g1~~TRINITY_DN2968_c0_g1_i2.p1  ORF type:complete len:436 (-),score=108.16 TRINITY_DN2968_c0_g1_i2:229-1536(-)